MKSDIEQITDYLDDEMSQEEKALFEAKIEAEPSLRAKMQERKTLLDSIEKSFLKEELGEFYRKNRKKSLIQKSIIRYGTAACVILGVTFLVFQMTNNPSTKNFADYFTPYKNLAQINRGDQDHILLGKGYAFYDLKLYDSAIYYFKLIEPSKLNPLNQTDYFFYLGVSCLALGNTQDMKTSFDRLKTNNRFQEQVSWYRGLAALKENKTSLAISELSKLKPHEFRHKDAQEIIDQLKQ